MKFIFYYKEQESVLSWHKNRLTEDNFTFKHIPRLFELTKQSFSKYHQIEVLENLDVKFTYLDDYKVKLIELYPNDIITDPDIVLHKKLNIPPDFDVYIDRNHFRKVVKSSYYGLFERYKQLPVDNFFQTKHHPNVGFLYFKNLELKEKYLTLYYKLKDWTYNNLEFNALDSTIIGQQSLGYLINEYNYKPCYLNEVIGNDYSHYIGDIKYKLNFKQIYKSII